MVRTYKTAQALPAGGRLPGSSVPHPYKRKISSTNSPLFCGGVDAVLKKKENIGKYVVKAGGFPV